MKTLYQDDLEKRIATLENNYGYLKQKTDELERDLEFESKLAVLKKKLAELKGRGEEAWEEVKDKSEEAMRDAEACLGKLKARFTKK